MRLFINRNQVAVRLGIHWMGIRKNTMRELHSERNRRSGWSVKYLPFGLRAFYRRGF